MTEEKTYLIPETINEALALAKKHKENFKYIAGGTDIMPNKFQELENETCLIDITNISALREVKFENNFLSIGSLIKLDKIKTYNEIKKNYTVLIEAANAVGTPLIRKTATIGGNILCDNRCIFYNQSQWWREAAGFCLKLNGDICIASGGKKACFAKCVSDMAPALISLNALLKVVDVDGEKIIELEKIYTGDGINPHNISKTAIIISILLPLCKGSRAVFKKLRQRESMEFTSLTTVVNVNSNNELKIVLTGVDPKPVVIKGTINDAKENLIKEAIKKSRVIDNEIFSRSYRREMIKAFLECSFKELKLI